MADESDIALAVMRIADQQKNGVATFPRSKREVPIIVKLDKQNTSPSQTRNGEPMWHQLLRNIQSHHKSVGNYINLGYLIHVPRVGYQITASGRKHLRSLGY